MILIKWIKIILVQNIQRVLKKNHKQFQKHFRFQRKKIKFRNDKNLIFVIFLKLIRINILKAPCIFSKLKNKFQNNKVSKYQILSIERDQEFSIFFFKSSRDHVGNVLNLFKAIRLTKTSYHVSQNRNLEVFEIILYVK